MEDSERMHLVARRRASALTHARAAQVPDLPHALRDGDPRVRPLSVHLPSSALVCNSVLYEIVQRIYLPI